MRSGSLLAAVHRPEDFPDGNALPVVAFGGRSNVGKSSLLNRLLGARAARVSRTPGRTQGIYFYRTGRRWMAADLPGYGYARAPKTDRAAWGSLLQEFFERRVPDLTAILADPTIPFSDLDRDFRDYLRDLQLSSICVATKADRLTQAERLHAKRMLKAELGSVCFVSSRTGEGIEELKREIDKRIHNAQTSQKSE